jgi:surfeit locus 1 family protein
MNRRAWAVLLATVVTAAVTARLGWWQLDRAAQKNSLRAAREAQGWLPMLAAGDLARDPLRAAGQWHRKAGVEGVWLADLTVYLDNRPMAGRTGFFVTTPLLLDDGQAVIVQRGWLPRDATDRTRIAPHRTEAGRVRVEGRIAPSPSRLYDLGSAASGPIRQNLDIANFARETQRPLLPLVIVQDDASGATTDGLSRQWPQPASDVHKHYGYAFQWFGLSGLAVTLYVWFQLLRPRRRAAD